MNLPDSGDKVSLREAYAAAKAYLSSCGIEEAANDAWILLAYVCALSRADYLAEPEKKMTGKERDAFTALVEKRGSRIPLQHLTKEQDFMGFTFRVSPQALIPRQDTETLVEKALELIPEEKAEDFRLLDLCTGSGCIALSLSKLRRGLVPVASDISEEALAVAKENAFLLGVKLELVRSDLFADLSLRRFDLIVSNPPYIPSAVIGTLPEEVQREPRLALDGGRDGLDFYRRILEESPGHLRPNGRLIVEIAYDEGAAVEELFSRNGFSEIELTRDLSGLDRVVSGTLKARGFQDV